MPDRLSTTQKSRSRSDLLAGLLAENVFQPMFESDGRFVDDLSWLVGTGDARGIGFLLIIMGVLITAVSIMSWRSLAIRNLDRDVPDFSNSAEATADAGSISR
ncbi:MAG: hypothetical protein DRJ28_00515 [Actinobacteria bacterium]|nr:MAG: hypothetical protein DRJ28_00515 [Actinomycetota bacterium]